MRRIIMIASAAAMAFSMPALAEAQGKGKGASAKAQHSASVKRNAKATRNQARPTNRTTRQGWVDRNRDGIDDRTQVRTQNRHGGNVCPPGLAKKTPACVPPGQAGRMFSEGQRLPVGYNFYTDYNRIPEPYRIQVPYLESNRYIYRDDRVYIVDPTTRLVTRIIDLIR